MSNYLSLFPSKWLAAADMEEQDRVVRIKQIIPSEEVGQQKDRRPIVYFQGVEKGLVLNKTNAKRIAKLYGADTDNWIGRYVTLYPSECDFGDDVVACLRIRATVPIVDNPQKPDVDDLSDEELEILIERKRQRAKTAAS